MVVKEGSAFLSKCVCRPLLMMICDAPWDYAPLKLQVWDVSLRSKCRVGFVYMVLCVDLFLVCGAAE